MQENIPAGKQEVPDSGKVAPEFPLSETENNGHNYTQPRHSRLRENGLIEEFDAGPVERLSLFTVLNNMAARLETLETSISKQSKAEGKSWSEPLLELAKIVLGGWPAFGFLFLLLFYSPLSKALSSIPDKVRTANEIQLPGVSLKTTIEQVAATSGSEQLAKTIPNLSSSAIELLLKAPHKELESLLSYSTLKGSEDVTTIYFPSESRIKALTELNEKELVIIQGGFGKSEPMDGRKLEQFISKLKTRFPGAEEVQWIDNDGNTVQWALNDPRPWDSNTEPRISWKLTDSGVKAVNFILEAVTKELSQAEQDKEN